MSRQKSNPVATWSISLDVDCPHCGQYVNLLDAPDFWDGRELDVAEHNTERSQDVEVFCPECAREFLVDLTY